QVTPVLLVTPFGLGEPEKDLALLTGSARRQVPVDRALGAFVGQVAAPAADLLAVQSGVLVSAAGGRDHAVMMSARDRATAGGCDGRSTGVRRTRPLVARRRARQRGCGGVGGGVWFSPSLALTAEATLSVTALPRSRATSETLPSTLWTPFFTVGLCPSSLLPRWVASYPSRPARAPRTYPTPAPTMNDSLPMRSSVRSGACGERNDVWPILPATAAIVESAHRIRRRPRRRPRHRRDRQDGDRTSVTDQSETSDHAAASSTPLRLSSPSARRLPERSAQAARRVRARMVELP